MCWVQQAAVQCGAFPVQRQAVAGAEAATLSCHLTPQSLVMVMVMVCLDSDDHDNLDRGNSDNGYG